MGDAVESTWAWLVPLEPPEGFRFLPDPTAEGLMFCEFAPGAFDVAGAPTAKLLKTGPVIIPDSADPEFVDENKDDGSDSVGFPKLVPNNDSRGMLTD